MIQLVKSWGNPLVGSNTGRIGSLRLGTVPRLLTATTDGLYREGAALWRYGKTEAVAARTAVAGLAHSVAVTLPREIALGERAVSEWVGYTRRNLARHLRLIL